MLSYVSRPTYQDGDYEVESTDAHPKLRRRRVFISTREVGSEPFLVGIFQEIGVVIRSTSIHFIEQFQVRWLRGVVRCVMAIVLVI